MHGGVKFYRGSAAAARSYVEADHSRADDYYLAEGSGVAKRFSASLHTQGCVTKCMSERSSVMDGETYERWVAGYDVESGQAKGRLRNDDNALRFVEVVVNGPKTWSLVASLHPDIADAYDAAQTRAAEEIIEWIAEHGTTRVGPRDRQVQVSVERIEAAVIRHYTSRAGDPHRHLHLQINARVFAKGAWRGLHSVGVRDSIEAINGIGHAAVMCDPGFRAAVTAHGYTLDESGEVEQLAPYVGGFSARSGQIARNVDSYEAQWRADHPGQEPGPRLRRSWDRRAWADARPDKVVPADGADLVARWNDELHDLGFKPPTLPGPEPPLKDLKELKAAAPAIGAINRDVAAELILLRLGAKRSAWNSADIRGEAEKLIASIGVVAERPARLELAEDITSRVVAASRPLLERDDVPEHIRSLTSQQVLAVEADIVDRLVARAELSVSTPGRFRVSGNLDPAQREVVSALAGDAGLLVIEGAAGTGKTTTLAAAREALEQMDRRLVVVTPTLKAAEVAREQVGAAAFSAASFVHQHGHRWDEDGRRSRTDIPRHEIPALARLAPGDVLLVDEAGMLDQDTARALLDVADRANATVAFLGDRHQLPAVGRGGVLDLATRWVRPEAHLELESVHRFSDSAYADLSLLMRTGKQAGDVFGALVERGQVVIHASEVERTAVLAEADGLVIADTREQVSALNAAIRDRRVDGDAESDGPVTRRGERIGLGDRVATRRNDRDLSVANRDTWTVAGVGEDGSLLVVGRAGQRELPAEYVNEHVELAYATTVYGAQGDTVDHAHFVVGETTGAAAAYVGMTRGRDDNVAHLVADSLDDARRQWVDVFSRDRADLGPGHAAEAAAEDMERYGAQAPPRPPRLQAQMLQTGVRRPPAPVPAAASSPSRGISP